MIENLKARISKEQKRIEQIKANDKYSEEYKAEEIAFAMGVISGLEEAIREVEHAKKCINYYL